MMNRYNIEEIHAGMEENFWITITEDMMESFCDITGDCNPLHCNLDYAISQGYRDKVVYGMLTMSFFSTVAGMYLPGEKSLIRETSAKFIKPVYIGDKLNVCAKVEEIQLEYQIILIQIIIYNEKKEKVVRGKMQIGFVR